MSDPASEKASNRAKYLGLFEYGCCVPTSDLLWMTIVVFIFGVCLCIFCCLSGTFVRWVYKRRMRKKCDTLREKYRQEDKFRKEMDIRLKQIAMKPTAPPQHKHDMTVDFSKIIREELMKTQMGNMMAPQKGRVEAADPVVNPTGAVKKAAAEEAPPTEALYSMLTPMEQFNQKQPTESLFSGLTDLTSSSAPTTAVSPETSTAPTTAPIGSSAVSSDQSKVTVQSDGDELLADMVKQDSDDDEKQKKERMVLDVVQTANITHCVAKGDADLKKGSGRKTKGKGFILCKEEEDDGGDEENRLGETAVSMTRAGMGHIKKNAGSFPYWSGSPTEDVAPNLQSGRQKRAIPTADGCTTRFTSRRPPPAPSNICVQPPLDVYQLRKEADRQREGRETERAMDVLDGRKKRNQKEKVVKRDESDKKKVAASAEGQVQFAALRTTLVQAKDVRISMDSDSDRLAKAAPNMINTACPYH